MNLHKNKELFIKTIERIKEETGIKSYMLEKDYYVTLFLHTLAQHLSNLIFKGGTSLSKAFRVINRFSEDIDLTVVYEEKLTQGQYKKIKGAIVKTAAELDLKFLNLEQTRSRRDFNRYEIDYGATFDSSQIKECLLVETSLAVRSFPTEQKPIRSLIHDFFIERNLNGLIKEYEFTEFSIRVQSLDRTLIDKLFALGDYYIKGREDGHSRHLYDIYKLLPFVKIDDNFRRLFKEVREVRKSDPYCYSAKEGIDLQKLLEEILSKNSYKKDYEEKTAQLLFEEVPYSAVKAAVEQILLQKIF